MGIRVGFYFGGPDGLLSCFLNSPLDQFQEFLVETSNEFPGDISSTSLQLVEEVKSSGVHALKRATVLDYKSVDVFIADWMLFLDVGHKYKLAGASDSWIKVHNYKELRDVFEARGFTEIARLLTYIPDGRPILRHELLHPFYAEDEVLKVGYWTSEEARFLREAISELSGEEWSDGLTDFMRANEKRAASRLRALFVVQYEGVFVRSVAQGQAYPG
ncbi:hypothetical protein V3W47_14220, partial [Deinococcus sp. YIM 134068]|uniref:hypothetical protein n=1 Tax=Deinococcus lichenicola TaxID=3118910 RepID=UPI002F91C7D0